MIEIANLDMPIFHTYDDRWANYMYSDTTISESGTLPCCFAMIMYWYDCNVTPPMFARLILDFGVMTSNLFRSIKNAWGIEFKHATDADELKEVLREGIPAIVADVNELFSVFIRLHYDEDGNVWVILNDPHAPSESNTFYDTKSFPVDEIFAAIGTKYGFDAWYPVTPRNKYRYASENSTIMSKLKSQETLSSAEESRYIGFDIDLEDNEMIHITMLPKDKTYCEPIYPDYCLLPYL